MEIQDGNTASTSYIRMIASETPKTEKANIKDALHVYCARDTEAMVDVYDALLIGSH